MRKTRADRYWFSDPRVTRVPPIKEILYSCSPPPSPPAGNHKVCPRLGSVSFMDILKLVSQYYQITLATIKNLDSIDIIAKTIDIIVKIISIIA